MYRNRFKEIGALKAKIDAFRPLSADVVKQIREYYRIGLTYTSNALEGNTLDLAETKVVLEDGLTISGKPLKDHLETLGHAQAYDKLFELSKKDFISEDDIKTLHKLFYSKIDLQNAGVYREKPVIVTGADIDIDGNGRVARLLMNLALLQSGYNITTIPPVVRADYIRALQASNKNEFGPFMNFISEMVFEAQKEYIRIIERLQ